MNRLSVDSVGQSQGCVSLYITAIHIQTIPVTMFKKSYNRPGPCEITDLYNGTARTQDFMLAWLQLYFLAGDISMRCSAVTSAHAVQPSLSITDNGTNFGRPLITMKGASNFFHFQGITTRL